VALLANESGAAAPLGSAQLRRQRQQHARTIAELADEGEGSNGERMTPKA
jgi:hypothetical protein